MSRVKQYDRIELLDKAVELFRNQGFNGTSTSELVETLGVNRKSMYAEFGSKQQLFEAVLERYDEHHLTRVISRFETEGAGVAGILSAFKYYASAGEGPYRGLGCLMCNTAVDRGGLEESSGKFVDAYISRLSQAFHQALITARNQNELTTSIDVGQLAGFLTTVLIGMASSLRAKAPAEQLWASYHMVANMLEGFSS